MKIKAWAIVEIETDEDQRTPKGEPYILFNFDNQGQPHLNVFDYSHREYAEQYKRMWQHAHPNCEIVPCTIEIGE